MCSCLNQKHCLGPMILNQGRWKIMDSLAFGTKEMKQLYCPGYPPLCRKNGRRRRMRKRRRKRIRRKRMRKGRKELMTTCSLSSSWVALMQEYPQLCGVALKFILPLTSMYLWEAEFLKMTALKSKYHN